MVGFLTKNIVTSHSRREKHTLTPSIKTAAPILLTCTSVMTAKQTRLVKGMRSVADTTKGRSGGATATAVPDTHQTSRLTEHAHAPHTTQRHETRTNEAPNQESERKIKSTLFPLFHYAFIRYRRSTVTFRSK